MSVIFQTETYVILHCSECGIGFAITSDFNNRRKSDRQSFYCPSGHSQWFPGKTDYQRIKELQAQVASREDLLQTTRRDRDKEWRLRKAAEGKTRAVKRRVAAGVCPCCTRTFQNLAAHMHSQHPGFPEPE